jgi:hypothetical protein
MILDKRYNHSGPDRKAEGMLPQSSPNRKVGVIRDRQRGSADAGYPAAPPHSGGQAAAGSENTLSMGPAGIRTLSAVPITGIAVKGQRRKATPGPVGTRPIA